MSAAEVTACVPSELTTKIWVSAMKGTHAAAFTILGSTSPGEIRILGWRSKLNVDQPGADL